MSIQDDMARVLYLCGGAWRHQDREALARIFVITRRSVELEAENEKLRGVAGTWDELVESNVKLRAENERLRGRAEQWERAWDELRHRIHYAVSEHAFPQICDSFRSLDPPQPAHTPVQKSDLWQKYFDFVEAL